MKTAAQYTGVAVIAFLLGMWVWHEFGERPALLSDQLRAGSYESGKLTNPLLECLEQPEEITIGDRVNIERKVTEYAEQMIAAGKLTNVSVYFRDLNNGPWFGINERDTFTPGSLLKLPLAISLYKNDQRTPGLLDTPIEYLGRGEGGALENDFGSSVPLPPGTYTIHELLEKTVKESNNDAAQVLAEFLSIDRVQEIYSDLGILVPQQGKDYSIDVKTFGAFFRILFNASYIGEPASNELLSYLTESSFDSGLERGVPSTVRVAHKFGTRSYGANNLKQLHDCGIVYAEKTPYILCVMTQGKSFDDLTTCIADISKIVYEGVSSAN